MANKTRLTNNSDETEISSLLSGDSIFVIPYFQRAYKWRPDRIKELNKDFVTLVEGDGTDLHFLGAVIVHGRSNNPSDPKYFEIIDGQQRITTLFLYICAAVKILCEQKEYSDAESLFLKYLVIGRDIKGASNLKLHSSRDDRKQLNYVIYDLLSDAEFKRRTEKASIKLLPESGKDKGPLRTNYGLAYEMYKTQCAVSGVAGIRAAYTAILNQTSVVQIDVQDPTNGPKIFDRLNSRQEPMTIGDLVRNEIFSKVANEAPERIERIYQEHWQPFSKKFRQGKLDLFESYFFPYGLTRNPNLKKSEVYSKLRDSWIKEDAPDKIIAELTEFQDAFIDIVCGTNLQGHTKPVTQAFLELKELGAPGSTYPFLMQLSNGVKSKSVSQEDAVATLRVIQSFLVRRAVAGHEPTGLHAVFKRLWVDCGTMPTADSVTMAIKKHKTVVWPDNTAVERAIKTRALYGAAITPYLLIQYDKSLKGDNPNVVPWTEHVLPQNPVPPWFEKFTTDQHTKLKDLLANLIPLSSEMNSSLKNKEYAVKKPRYLEDSMFKSARSFAEKHDDWTPEALSERGEKLAAWAIDRWPIA